MFHLYLERMCIFKFLCRLCVPGSFTWPIGAEVSTEAAWTGWLVPGYALPVTLRGRPSRPAGAPGPYSHSCFKGREKNLKMVLTGPSNPGESSNSSLSTCRHPSVSKWTSSNLQSSCPLNCCFLTPPQGRKGCVQAPLWYPSLIQITKSRVGIHHYHVSVSPVLLYVPLYTCCAEAVQSAVSSLRRNCCVCVYIDPVCPWGEVSSE